MGFTHHFLGPESEKLKNVRVADYQLRLIFLGALLCQFREFLFIARQTGTLIVEAGYLALQFSNRPVAPDAFHFVKSALGGIVKRNQLN